MLILEDLSFILSICCCSGPTCSLQLANKTYLPGPGWNLVDFVKVDEKGVCSIEHIVAGSCHIAEESFL